MFIYSCQPKCFEYKQLTEEAINNFKFMKDTFDKVNPPLIFDFKNITNEIHCVLQNTTDTFEYNCYILILGLKLYEYQYGNYHQGYQLNIRLIPFFTDRITSELIRITNPKDDYLTPRIAYDYVKNNTVYMSNKQVQKLMDSIEEIEKSINTFSN